ncbi:hypothetical protein [Pararhizobium sp. DWP3-4]|uniref:hypothetical protein n=1 Tax=Pararhizobium sp. DWP3-4 TaxID=2804565 RepID=UPI003CF22210
MNRIFADEGGWLEFPERSFARLDHFEPADLTNAKEAVFSFDAVDDRWLSNEFRQVFPNATASVVQSRMARAWKALFGSGARNAVDFFDDIPVYNIEVTVRPRDPFWGDIVAMINLESWIEIRLSHSGPVPVDVYGAIFADSVGAALQAISPAPANVSQLLSALFDADNWPDASDEEVDAVLKAPNAIETLAMYDVGQGSAIGLLDSANRVNLYFDVGAGCYGNKHTRPSPLRFCWKAGPSIVLSHWDTDHWAGASSDKAARGHTWLAPRQSGLLGPKHHLFAGRILKQGGTLRIWNAGKGMVQTVSLNSGQDLSIVKCSGKDMNGSGIAMILDDASANSSWLLTGDAGYGEIGLLPRFPVSAVTVPHHGADMTSKGGSPPSRPSGYARLLYSFGPDNKHGKSSISHPTHAAFTQHATWSHGSWSSAAIATTVPGGEVLAATH